MPRDNNNNSASQLDDVPDLSALFDEEAIESSDYHCCPTLPPLHFALPFIFKGLYHAGELAQALTERRDHFNAPIPTGIVILCSIGGFAAAYEVNGINIRKRMDDTCIFFRSGRLPSHWRDRREELLQEWQPLSPRREKVALWLSAIGTLSISVANGFAGFLFLDNMPSDYENFPFRDWVLTWKFVFGVTGIGITVTSTYEMFMPYYSAMRKILMQRDVPFLPKLGGVFMWTLGTCRMAIQTYSVMRAIFPIENASIANYCLLGSIIPIMPLLGANNYVTCTEGYNVLRELKNEGVNWPTIISLGASLGVTGLLIYQLFFLNRSFLVSTTEDYDEYNPDSESATAALNFTTALFCLEQMLGIMLGTFVGSKITADAVQKKLPALLAKFSCFSRTPSRLIANDAAIDEQSPLINDAPIQLEENPRNRCGLI